MALLSILINLLSFSSRPDHKAATRRPAARPASRTPSRSTRLSSSSLFLASDPSKRWAELFFLLYSPFWMVWALGIVVPFRLYERFGAWGYAAVGLAAAVPCVVLPLLIPGETDATLPLTSRFWVKATAFIATFSFIGNWFWTHYFYELLGAAYTLPSHDWNRVPVCMYLLTHAYFCFYHALGNVLQRGARRAAVRAGGGRTGALAAQALTVFLLSYATAWGETATIAHFPHYRFADRARMYKVGSLFYAIYFFVSFPVFLALDGEEEEGENRRGTKRTTVWSAFCAALASGMAVTILLDLWRVAFGGIAPVGGGGRWVEGARKPVVGRWARLPWMVGVGAAA